MVRERVNIHIQPTKLVNGSNGFAATYSGEWVSDEIWFAGKGKDWDEAIGQFIMANRENLNITFKITDKDGSVGYSTVYGRARTQEEI